MNQFIMRTHNYGEVQFRLCGTYIYVVWVDMLHVGERSGGGDGQQICVGGMTSGNTIQAAPATYERIARRWYRSYCRRAAGAFCGNG